MALIVLIACVAKKKGQSCKAKDLYISPLFTYSLSYAKKLNPDKIFILSALHHLLELETEVQPYDVTLSSIPKKKRKPGLIVLNAVEKEAWGQKVVELLSEKTDLNKDKFVILAGNEYIKPIHKNLRNLSNPLKGLPQGKRVSFLKFQLNANRIA